MAVRGVKFKFDPSESVLCFEPDVTKARVLYNAKILELHVGRKTDGVRQPEYLVHFLGWKSSWDRIVPEHCILSNSEEHRNLMKLLAQTAKKIKRNKQRKRKIEALLRKYFSKDPEMAANFRNTLSSSQSESDTVGDESGSEEDSEMDSTYSELGTTGDIDATLTESEDMKDISQEDIKLEVKDGEPQEVHLELPENLKRRLEDDCYFVSCQNKIVELPASPNVISVLEGYVKNFTANLIYGTTEKRHPRRDRSKNPPHKNVELVKEAMDGLRVFFDFTLPLVLLYGSEREQYHTAMKNHAQKCTTNTAATTMDIPDSTEQNREKSQEAETVHSPRLRSRPGPTSQTLSPTSRNGCLSPRGSRLSPRVSNSNCGMKKEVEESTLDESPPPTSRRVKRNTLADSGRKRVFSENKTDNENQTVKEKSGKYEDSNTLEEEPGSRRNSLRSGATKQTQFAELVNTTRTKRKSGETSKGGTAVLSDRVTVPPPLVLAECSKDSMSSQNTPNRPSSESSDPSMIYCNGYKTKEAAMDHICTWRLVPDSVLAQKPDMPSAVYGAHHLLRLFVQLPNILSQMAIPSKQHKALMSHLEMFVDYLSERSEELFPESVYKEFY